MGEEGASSGSCQLVFHPIYVRREQERRTQLMTSPMFGRPPDTREPETPRTWEAPRQNGHTRDSCRLSWGAWGLILR